MGNTVQDELDQLVEEYSEEKVRDAHQEIGLFEIENREKIEEELTECCTVNEMREELEDEVSLATITDVGLTEETSRDIEGKIYFELSLPCHTTKIISFSDQEFGKDKAGNKFLNSVNSTVSDLSDAKGQNIPIVYEYSDCSWNILVYYGDRETITKIKKDTNKYTVLDTNIHRDKAKPTWYILGTLLPMVLAFHYFPIPEYASSVVWWIPLWTTVIGILGLVASILVALEITELENVEMQRETIES